MELDLFSKYQQKRLKYFLFMTNKTVINGITVKQSVNYLRISVKNQQRKDWRTTLLQIYRKQRPHLTDLTIQGRAFSPKQREFQESTCIMIICG